LKATSEYEEAFSFSREIIGIISSYDTFEARTLDAFDGVCKLFQKSRIEKICYLLISKDNLVTEKIKMYLNEQEKQIIVPFSFSEISSNKNNNYFIRNKMREHFYSKDLFDYSDPLKKDLYFFGRNNVVMGLIDKHINCQNSGLFGLRKTGKTSIIFDVIRKLPDKNALGVWIDCQSTSFHIRRWYKALYYLLLLTSKEFNVELEYLKEDDFTETNAAELFEKFITEIFKKVNKSIMLLFDEIENISYEKSASDHWCSGLDFVYFWQTLRTVHQKSEKIFTFSIIGTNPKCIEMVSIQGKDNPIFNILTPIYIPGFDVQQTREMVRKLGRLMGIKFEEPIYSKLTEDYGGHPFLIRHICSAISQSYTARPVTIDRIKYEDVNKDFKLQKTDYFDMLIEVLDQFYKIEYEMLELLAVGDLETFRFYAENDYSSIKHLIGYGIIKELDGNFDFRIDALKYYLLKKTGKKHLHQTKDQKWEALCKSRNNLEIELRMVVRKVLRIIYRSYALDVI